MAFINDLPGAVSSMCAMYADDTKFHGPVNNRKDGDRLQKDLDALVNWADTWQHRFNADVKYFTWERTMNNVATK